MLTNRMLLNIQNGEILTLYLLTLYKPTLTQLQLVVTFETFVFVGRTHFPDTGLDVLKVQRISQSQAWQRTGRAGREAAGVCYRCYTKQVCNISLLINT
jgi:hypothetical protein